MLDPAETQDSGHSGAMSVVVDTLAASLGYSGIIMYPKSHFATQDMIRTRCVMNIDSTNGHRLSLSSIQLV